MSSQRTDNQQQTVEQMSEQASGALEQERARLAQEHAAHAIARLSCRNGTIQADVCKQGGIARLLALRSTSRSPEFF